MSQPVWFTWKDPTTMHRTFSVRLAHVAALDDSTKDYSRIYIIGQPESWPIGNEQLATLKKLLGVNGA